MTDLDTNTSTTNAYQCDGCGAPLIYKPGTTYLVCEHCGSKKSIDQTPNEVTESDFNKYIENFEQENLSTTKVITCSNCKATPTVDENLKSMACPYCGSPLVEKNVHQERYIKPGYVSPFQINKEEINNILGKWVKGLWFAPNKIQRAALSPLNLNGIYMPFWTFDAQTTTDYKGQRGDAYYVTVGSGKNRRTERRIRWSSVRGTIENFYDDVLINGSNTLDPTILSKIQGWDTHSVLKINNSYLSGFITEKYQVNLKDAFTYAKQEIESSERANVRYAIGGDDQRISFMQTHYSKETFKHILLPIYVSSFRYQNKLYSFYVNGSTGRISGKRPYSKWKIAFAILGGIAVVAILYYLFSQSSSSSFNAG